MPEGSIAPSTTQTPYITPVDPKVSLVSLLSAGDTVSGAKTADGSAWRFAGIPDGLGRVCKRLTFRI